MPLGVSVVYGITEYRQCYMEFIAGNHREQNIALINMTFNFCETLRNENKVILENLVAVH